MNVYDQTKRKPYLTLSFDGGRTVVEFDNMEINRDVQVFVQWWPEIFQSASGIATKIARRQPRRVRFQVKLHEKETICKLNTLVALTATRYTLKFCIHGYWDCTTIKEIIVQSETGGGIDPGNRIASTQQLGGTPNTGLLTGGSSAEPAPTREEPQAGDLIVVGGQTLTATKELITVLKRKGVAILPFCMNAVLRYDQDLMYLGQGRGLGVNANTYHEFEVLESARLPIPLGTSISVGNDEDPTGNTN